MSWPIGISAMVGDSFFDVMAHRHQRHGRRFFLWEVASGQLGHTLAAPRTAEKLAAPRAAERMRTVPCLG